MQRWLGIIAILVSLVPGTGTADGTARRAPLVDPPTGRFLVQLRPEAAANRRSAQAAAGESTPARTRAAAVLTRVGITGAATRDLGANLVNVVGPTTLSPADEASWLASLAADPDVEYVDVDRRRHAHAFAGDALYVDQWYLQSQEVAAARLDTAWDRVTGAADTVVAVLDTGIRYDHPDLAGRLLPGYDFVSGENASSFRVANDGDGWDADASDPGDWLSSADRGQAVFNGCDILPSSWHGTRVAGMIGAVTNNGSGIAGGTWAGGILPVRVLGKCGGYDSDIIAGMRWAAGLPVAGAPTNPNPAQILNMSLGAIGTCARPYRDAMTDLNAAGVLVIASAGNENGPVDAPANCPGIVAVGGLRHVGTKVGYSSQGPEVAISAPAGNCVNEFGACLFSLITTSNDGSTTPDTNGYTDEFDFNIGTSFSAPVVAAIAALMHGANANLRGSEYTQRLQAGARAFPPPDTVNPLPTCPATDVTTGQCNCTTTTCGAGIADADGAVREALRPIARIARPPSTAPGARVTLNGTTSAAARGRTITGYSWTVVAGPGDVTIANANLPTASVEAPVNGTATIRLTVTDSANRSDTATLTVGGTPSGGGGGGVDGASLAALLGLGLLRRRRARPQR